MVEITVSGNTPYGDMDGRVKVPLVVQSETFCSGLYGLGVEFVKQDARSDSGEPVQLLVRHVSGDCRFARNKWRGLDTVVDTMESH